MSKKINPSIVIDAVTTSTKQISNITLNPVSIYRYCLLEKINSPFIDSAQAFSVEGVIPSIYILSVDKEVLKTHGGDKDKIIDAAMDWSDENISIKDLPEVIKAIVDIFTSLNSAAPSSSASSSTDKSSKKKM